MVKVRFFTDSDNCLIGFDVSGHAGAGIAGQDPICAAVSSAAYMAANTITDVLHGNAQISVADGHMKLMLGSKNDAQLAQQILEGFKLHMKGLSEEYPENVKVKNGGVTKCLK